MSRQAQTHITPEEYLSLKRRSEYKNEYFDGEIFAMVGAGRKHNLISPNIAAGLRAQLRGRPCETYGSDMRIRIPNANIYTYADITVACGEPKFEDAHVDPLLNPNVSASTNTHRATCPYIIRACPWDFRDNRTPTTAKPQTMPGFLVALKK